MSARRQKAVGLPARRDGETRSDWARRIFDRRQHSSRQIAEHVGLHPTSVLYATNPEMRRDKIRAERRKRFLMTPAERGQESAARQARADLFNRWADGDVRDLSRLAADGCSPTDIARALGKTVQAVVNKARHLGITIVGRAR